MHLYTYVIIRTEVSVGFHKGFVDTPPEGRKVYRYFQCADISYAADYLAEITKKYPNDKIELFVKLA